MPKIGLPLVSTHQARSFSWVKVEIMVVLVHPLLSVTVLAHAYDVINISDIFLKLLSNIYTPLSGTASHLRPHSTTQQGNHRGLNPGLILL
jgi:hypothetical protein